VLFSASPAFWKADEACLLSNPSRPGRSLCFAFQRFSFWLIPFREPPEPPVPCWRTVTTVYPLGNCDTLKSETFLSVDPAQRGFFFRVLPLSPFFAFTDSARTLPEELVNFASVACPFGPVSEGMGQPAWPNLCPVAWDYPWGCFHFLSSASAHPGNLVTPCVIWCSHHWSHDPTSATPPGLALTRFSLYPLRSPLLRVSRKSFSLCRFHLATRPAVRLAAPSKRNRQSYSPRRFHLGTPPAVRRVAPSQWNRQGFELRSSSSRRNRC
jgi:hypothetical protein